MSYKSEVYRDTTGAQFKSKEGQVACREAIDALLKAEKSEKIKNRTKLNKYAQDRLKDIFENVLSGDRETMSFYFGRQARLH